MLAYHHKLSVSLQLGPLGLLVLGAIATHCMVLLVRCAGTLCKRYIILLLLARVQLWDTLTTVFLYCRNSITSLDYSETLQFALIEQGYNRLGKIARYVPACTV